MPRGWLFEHEHMNRREADFLFYCWISDSLVRSAESTK